MPVLIFFVSAGILFVGAFSLWVPLKIILKQYFLKNKSMNKKAIAWVSKPKK